MEPYKTTPAIICPNQNCTKTPTIQITGLNQLEISCPCSKNIMKMTIQSYLNTLSIPKTKPFHHSSQLCRSHPSESNVSYCYDCDEHFCNKCPSFHSKSKHEVIRLYDLMTEDEFNDINQSLNQMKDFIYDIEERTNAISAELIRKADNVKKMYIEWKKQMQLNLYLVELLIKDYVSYDNNSFYAIDNILANCSFSFNTENLDTKLVDREMYSRVRNYFSSYPCVINQGFTNVNNTSAPVSPLRPKKNKIVKSKKSKSNKRVAIVAKDIDDVGDNNDDDYDDVDNDNIDNIDNIDDTEQQQVDKPRKKSKSKKKGKRKLDNNSMNQTEDNDNTATIQNDNKPGLINNETGIKEVRQINRHSDRTNLLIVLPDKRLCSCSCDGNIIIYNDNVTGTNTIRINNAHGKNISIKYIYYLHDNKLVSCGADKNLKFWKIESQSYELLKTIKAHSGTVNKVIQLRYPLIASCSEDALIHIWSAKTYKKISTLTGHKGSVYTILYIANKEMIISAGKDSILRLWNLSTKQCLKKRKGIYCFESSHSLCLLSTGNVALSGKHQIVIFDPEDLELLDVVEDKFIDNTFVSCFLNIGNNLICGTDCGKMCNVDLETNKIVFKAEVHFDFISSLVKYGKNLFVSGSWDMSRIKFWKF